MATKQIIFVVETDNRSRTDDVYIIHLLKSCFDLTNNDVTYKFIHLGAKTKYNKVNVQKKIKYYVNQNKKGSNHIIICMDTDNIEFDVSEVKFLKEVENYCSSNNYEFVWFCREIEEVFLDKIIDDNEKIKESIKSAKSNYLSKWTRRLLPQYNRWEMNCT